MSRSAEGRSKVRTSTLATLVASVLAVLLGVVVSGCTPRTVVTPPGTMAPLVDDASAGGVSPQIGRRAGPAR